MATEPHTGSTEDMPDPTPPSGAGFERAGDFVGPYKLMAVLGEGGFGTVWLAERREPMVQRVALKIIKPGMDSKSVIARFEQERQALAVMDHPNVARVFDGGVTERGRPYFVMEHVQGEPITTFCDRHTYTIRQRLELFIPVCEAVQHAHMKGIIHRDIKPSNVLVSIKDGNAIVKVIDFGIAKAISHTMTDKTIFTETGQLIGTPEYMSPEQAEMGAVDIDTRTDVYSLGVVLYELLVGTLPFDAKELRARGYAEIQRVIREVEPPTPSKRLTTIDDKSGAEIARTRQEERVALARLLRSELEWIPLKAMRKDRRERYRGPDDLADDVRAFLEGRVLEAGPRTVWYRFHRFHRRNRHAIYTVAALGAVVSSLLWYALESAADARRTRVELAAAHEEFLFQDRYGIVSRWASALRDRSNALATFRVEEGIGTQAASDAFAREQTIGAAIRSLEHDVQLDETVRNDALLRLSKLKDTSVQQVAGFYNREAWTLLADVGVSLADALKAEMMAERAIRIWNDQELDPDSNHLNTLGLAYLRTGRFQDSIDVLALASTLLMQRTSGKRARSEDSLFSAIAHANLGNVQEAERMRVNATEVGSWSINERLRDALFDELNVAISRSRDAKTPAK